ncbi:unnamed protein product, partial [Rotaria sp. Silwood2]
MQTEKVTDTQLTCYTPPLPEGSYGVKVFVEGNEVQLSQYTYGSLPTFRSSEGNRPRITRISPASGLPQRVISLYGDFKSRCYLRDVEGCSEANIPIISRIYIGGQSCNLIDEDNGDYYYNLNNTYLRCRFESNEVGGRGLHVYYQSGSTDLNNLDNSSPPMPSIGANRTWTEEASFFADFSSPATIWLIGFIRAPMTAIFIFHLDASSDTDLYLSTDENPDNKVKIANRTNPDSMIVMLQNNT